MALFVVACMLRPGPSRTRCKLMRGSRERGLNLIVCFVLCHVSLMAWFWPVSCSLLLAAACWPTLAPGARRRDWRQDGRHACGGRRAGRARFGRCWGQGFVLSWVSRRAGSHLSSSLSGFQTSPSPPLPLDSLSYLRRRVLSGSCPRLSFVFSRLFKCPDLTRRQTNAGDTCVRTNDRSGVWTCD